MLVRSFILLLAAVLVLAGCRGWLPVTSIVGSGRSVTQSFDFSDFDRLEISDAFQAEVSAADGYVVEVTVNDNLVEHLQVEQQGTTVKIGLKPYTMVANGELRARIALPSLASLTASGASRARVTGFRADEEMELGASGASRVQGDMATGDLSADISGGSTLELAGSGGDLRVTASGASTANLREFAAGDADVEASGASRIAVNATGTLNAKASGASTVNYTGNPTLGSIDESGASSVNGR